MLQGTESWPGTHRGGRAQAHFAEICLKCTSSQPTGRAHGYFSFGAKVAATSPIVGPQGHQGSTRIIRYRDMQHMESIMNSKKSEISKSDLDRGLSVKKEDLKQLTVKTGLRGGVAALKAGCCSGCHCAMA
jgi:hypothetical protein